MFNFDMTDPNKIYENWKKFFKKRPIIFYTLIFMLGFSTGWIVHEKFFNAKSKSSIQGLKVEDFK